MTSNLLGKFPPSHYRASDTVVIAGHEWRAEIGLFRGSSFYAPRDRSKFSDVKLTRRSTNTNLTRSILVGLSKDQVLTFTCTVGNDVVKIPPDEFAQRFPQAVEALRSLLESHLVHIAAAKEKRLQEAQRERLARQSRVLNNLLD